MHICNFLLFVYFCSAKIPITKYANITKHKLFQRNIFNGSKNDDQVHNDILRNLKVGYNHEV